MIYPTVRSPADYANVSITVIIPCGHVGISSGNEQL